MAKVAKSSKEIAKLKLLGLRIRDARKAQNKTQSDVAFDSGIRRSHFEDIERGERNISALNIIKIAEALGLDAGSLFPSKEDIKNLDTY